VTGDRERLAAGAPITENFQMHAVWRIHDLVRDGRISAHDGAMLLELRRLIAWRRLPWWKRWLHILVVAVFE
jgi:hypothetical protein